MQTETIVDDPRKRPLRGTSHLDSGPDLASPVPSFSSSAPVLPFTYLSSLTSRFGMQGTGRERATCARATRSRYLQDRGGRVEFFEIIRKSAPLVLTRASLFGDVAIVVTAPHVHTYARTHVRPCGNVRRVSRR